MTTSTSTRRGQQWLSPLLLSLTIGLMTFVIGAASALAWTSTQASLPAGAVLGASGQVQAASPPREARFANLPTNVSAPAVVEPARVERPKARHEAQLTAATPVEPETSVIRNHFWFPKLGMSKRVHAYPCSRSRPPDNYLYRWGCAGRYNVYLLGHAYGVMKPLHDLYVRGDLKVGLLAKYANRRGVIRTYRVTEWRVVDPVDSHWAITDQPVRSMTLQTCVGRDGRYRLNVRLVEV